MTSSGLAIPGALFVGYYTHWFDDWIWIYEYRSRVGSEFLISLIGFPAGLVSGKSRWIRSPLLAVVLFGSFVPFSKPFLSPLERYYSPSDRWTDGVCRQTSPSTCGPAATATILHHLGIKATEAAIAKEAFTYTGGTECWYLARALRKRGLKVEFQQRRDGTLPKTVPSIAGVKLGRIGHFITILEQHGDQVVIGEPLRGRLSLNTAEIQQNPEFFTGFFMVIAQ